MRKSIVLSFILLLSAMWLLAQQNYPSQSTQSGQTSSTSNMSGSSTTVEGCLSESNGNYMLTDKTGNTYQLTGDTAKLRDHVGHEVQVKGMSSSSGESSPSGTMGSSSTSSSSSGAQSIQVRSLKHIASSCSNSR